MALIAFDARDAYVPMPHGSGIYVRRLVEALSLRPPDGHQLHVFRRGSRGPEVVFEQLGLPRALRRLGAALVHGPDSFLPLARQCRGVVTVHDLAFEAIPGEMPPRTTLKYRVLARAAARGADRVICPSSFTAEDVERRWRVPPERIRVIAEAAALPFGSSPPPAGPYLLAAGDLRPKKNLEVLVRAFASLHRGGLPHRLVLAGADLGQAAALHRLAGASPVQTVGFVDDARLDALVRGADAVVVPSRYEGFGLIALDAMARGCPVVLSRAGALPETGGDAALYFDPDDAGELEALLACLLDDDRDDERARLAAAGRARAAEFSWERTARSTVSVYEELL